MKAVQFNFTIPRYALGLALGKFFPSILWTGLGTTSLKEITEPVLPGPDWVRVSTRLGGICGSDLAAIYLHASTYYLPFGSFPFTFGHENVGTISELGKDVNGWKTGERVVIEPTLWCAPRGYAKENWCEYCARGEINLCQRYAEGALAPGIMTGTARDTGGSWSENFVAHESQLLAVPDELSDENALMVEPFTIGLHAALVDFPKDEETILIIGTGTIGLLTLAALRALGCKARILVSARYDFQGEAAMRLGADEVLRSENLYQELAEKTDGTLYKPAIGKYVLVGGADRVYECAGNDSTLDDAHRLAKSGGTVVIVGVPGQAKGVDWTAIFSQELTIIASDRYSHSDEFQGKKWRTFDLALDLMNKGKVDLGWMVSQKYAIEDYGQALNDLRSKRTHPIIKAVFEFPN